MTQETTKRIPLRKCTACSQMVPKKDLLRVILTPENEVLVDLTGKQNGRGAYLCKTKECLEKAKKQKSLERSLKTVISDSVYGKIAEVIESVD